MRLRFRGELPEARRLFEVAIGKNANDLESRLFPLLLAEIDGNAAEVRRLRLRAAEAYSRPEDLDMVLLLSIQELPEELAVRARETFSRKYKVAHPAEWPWRIMTMEAALLDGERKGERGDAAGRRVYLQRIDQEGGILRALPESALPEPSRSEFASLQLRARAGLGRCEEVAAELAGFEREAQTAYPARQDHAAPPPPRSAADVRTLRVKVREAKAQLARLKAAIADRSVARWPELAQTPAADRIPEAQEITEMIEASIAETEETLRDPEDARAAADWSGREHAAWEAEIHVTSTERPGIYDAAGRAERLSILVRASQGRCLLDGAWPRKRLAFSSPAPARDATSTSTACEP